MSSETGSFAHSVTFQTALRIWSLVGLFVAAGFILNLLGVLAPVIEFFAVGSLIAFVEAPIVNALEHRGVPRGVGALIGLIVVVSVLGVLVAIVAPVFFNQMLEILTRLPSQLRVVSEALSQLLTRFKSLAKTPMGSNIDESLSSVTAFATRYVSQLAGDFGKGMIPFISGFASQIFIIFLGLVLAYWLACDYPRMHREVCVILGEEKETSYRFMVAILSRSVGGYMRGMVITSLCGGVLAYIGFLIIGHPYAPLMAVITGFLHLVPVVGPWISSAFATVLAFIYDPMLGLWTLVVTVVAQNVTDNVVSPKVMQSAVQVHPAMSLTSLVIGSTLMGPIGMVIAIPLSAAIKGLFIFYFENDTHRQLVSYDGAIFKGTPYRDSNGAPVAAFDALGDTSFVDESELLTDDDVSEGEAVPKPELDNPWLKLPGLQSGGTGIWHMPFTDSDGHDASDDGQDEGR